MRTFQCPQKWPALGISWLQVPPVRVSADDQLTSCCLMTSCPLVGDHHRSQVTGDVTVIMILMLYSHRSHCIYIVDSDFLGKSGKSEEIAEYLCSLAVSFETYSRYNFYSLEESQCNVIMVRCLNHEMMDGIKE